MFYGVFEKIKILGLGVQVVEKVEKLSNFQTAIFCIIGSVNTVLVAYLLVSLTNIIVKCKSKMLLYDTSFFIDRSTISFYNL